MPPRALKRREQEEGVDLSRESPAAEVEALARQIIEQARYLPATDGLSGDGEDEDEVLFDLEADGVRCLIVRIHPKAASVSIALSPREQEIARMIAKGYPNKIIAAVLEISAWTVCTHIRRIFAKLRVGSRAEMVARLLENGSLAGAATNSLRRDSNTKDEA
jgi:two-component system nitrate/nitrite response regulator NarL